MCAALPARAADETHLRPTLDVEQGWDSNIYNDSDDAQGSMVTRITPSLWLENAGELGGARLGLTGIGRRVWEDSELSGIDALARGEFNRKLTPRLTLFGDGYLEHYSGYDEVDPDGLNQGDQLIQSEQPSWKRDRIGGGFRYMLTERLSATLSAFAGRVNYERLDTVLSSGLVVPDTSYRDSTELDGRSALMYQLTALDQVSLSVDYDDTSYQNLGTGTNDTSIWNSKIGWSRNWSPYLTTTASIGVRSLDTVQKNTPQSGSFNGFCFDANGQLSFTCLVPLEPRDFSNSGTGLIGSLVIKRLFARGSLEFAYDRDTRSTGGSGRTNFDIDSFTLMWTQRLAERVKLRLSGNYSMYNSVTDKIPSYAARYTTFPGEPLCLPGGDDRPVDSPSGIEVVQCFGGSSEEEREYTTLTARLDWQLRRTLGAYVVAGYYHSITDQTLGSADEIRTQDLDKFTVGAGFRYYYNLGL